MKKSAMALVCVSMLACWAQARSADADAPADAGAGAVDQQSEPAATPPASAAPADQPSQPSAAPQPGQTGQPSVSAPPELPKYPDVRMPGESGLWFGIGGSEPTWSPIFDKGRSSGYTTSSLITLQGKPKYGESAELGFAVGLHNALIFSGFSTRAAGDFATPVQLQLWSQTYNQGVLVSTDYRLENLKVSFEYLTWPYPVESRHFRLKTLWQAQYVNVKTGFDAPLLPITNSAGDVILNQAGQPVNYQAAGSTWFITPTVGLGATEYFSKFVRMDLKGSGFALPRRWTIWDGEGSVNFRFGHFELGGGVSTLHIKTSTSRAFYVRGTMVTPQVSLRWYLK